VATVDVVAAMVLRDGDVLLARRGPGMDLAGWWEFPGGKVEPGERAGETLVRELDEELGIRTAPGTAIGESFIDRPAGRIRLLGWTARLLDGEPRAREHDAVAWVRPDAVDRATLAPADVPLLDALLAHLDPAVGGVATGEERTRE
jgi:(d)CTP diphosphatase